MTREFQPLPCSTDTCTRGCEKFRPELIIYDDPGRPALLVLKLVNGQKFRFFLPRRYANTLLILLGEWHDQAALDSELRGYCKLEELGELWAGMPGAHQTVTGSGVKKYIDSLRAQHRKELAIRFGDEEGRRLYADLLESNQRRGLGYRLGTNGLSVVHIGVGARGPRE